LRGTTSTRRPAGKPLLRDGRYVREIEWDEALDADREKFKQIKKEHGPDALAFIASSKCTNEESYLMQKLARAVIGTNNVDNCSALLPDPATMGCSARWVRRRLGFDRGYREGGLVIIMGANPAESHPVLATRIKRSHKHRGQRLIVADLRKHEMAERADIFFGRILRPTRSGCRRGEVHDRPRAGTTRSSSTSG
jgi:formate dehydrogenase major subunit